MILHKKKTKPIYVLGIGYLLFKLYNYMKKIIIAFYFIIFLNLLAQEEKVYNSPEIVVTASKTPTPLMQLNRNVEVITSEKIDLLPVTSLPELLSLALGVDVKQRGTSDIQSDISIRGGSFEQTLVLINGIKISDPQTGHHNMNLPINLNDIERIEILKGPGSSIHGANALSGVINIITKQNNNNYIGGNFSYGSFGTYNLGINAGYNTGLLKNNFSFSKNHSNGYIHNTNYNNINFNYTPQIIFGNNIINILAGYQNKNFGANGFYSDKYPNQYEETNTTLLAINTDIVINNLSVSPKFSYRKHKDMYLLDYTRPSFYKNNHQTNSYNFQLESSYKSLIGTTSIGAEYGKDDINSTNLGNHYRNKYGISLEQKSDLFDIFNISLGGYLYKYDTFGWKFVPAIDLGIKLNENLRFITSYGKSFRLPTFTELYYSSPAQVGNPLLQPEEVWSVELGLKFKAKGISSDISGYYKKGTNLIDWSKQSNNNIWTANNIANLSTKGIEINFTADINNLFPSFFIKTVSLGYSFIETDNSKINYISKYILEHLKNQYIINISSLLPFEIKNIINMRYEQRINSAGYFICDTKFSKNFGYFDLSFAVNNIFDKYYTDFINIPLPGINIMGEIKYFIGEK